MPTGGHRFFAFAYGRLAPRAERRNGTVDRRRELLGLAEGRVLEVGAGTGLNLPHYPELVAEVIATEPDLFMLKRLTRSTVFSSVPVRVERAEAEALPLPDGSVDTVVATLVLCTVRDPALSLAEVRRVLRPGGMLLIYEHVRAEAPDLARRQDRWAGLWGRVAAGCHPNRDSVGAIEAAGFVFDELRRFDVDGTWLARPHVMGVARPLAS